MIVHVMDRAAEAGVGPVLCAAAEAEIADAVTAAGYNAVLTDPGHPSGSDRAWEALRRKDPDAHFDAVVNLQGDLPTLDPTPLASDGISAPALYFTRATAPTGDGPLWHHIGIYAYRRSALATFVGLAPGVLEKRERLEQLRALEAGMRIEAVRVDTVPLGVDTPADLERARRTLDPKR